MKKATSTLMLLLALVVTSVWAQGPNNSGTYYQPANGKKAAALKTALFNIIKSHTDIGYDGLIEAYHKTDTRADGKLRDWYSNATNYTWDDRNGIKRSITEIWADSMEMLTPKSQETVEENNI